MPSCVNNILTKLDKTSFMSNPRKSQSHRRKVLPFSYYKRLNASMTVEAALALPLFMFFIANILSLFIMYERYSVNLSKLHQTAKLTALAAHVTGGDDVVQLKVVQPITPLIKTIGFNGSTTLVTANIRKWTGYNVLNGKNELNEEEYVYITDTGSVYHRSRDCSHLKVDIEIVLVDEIGDARNINGAKYHKCEKCGNSSSTGIYFVTKQGDRYHSQASCSSLKRTIKVVKLSEVGGRGPCSLCG